MRERGKIEGLIDPMGKQKDAINVKFKTRQCGNTERERESKRKRENEGRD